MQCVIYAIWKYLKHSKEQTMYEMICFLYNIDMVFKYFDVEYLIYIIHFLPFDTK